MVSLYPYRSRPKFPHFWPGFSYGNGSNTEARLPQGTQGILTPAWSACGLRWWRFHGWWSTGWSKWVAGGWKNPPEISRNLGKSLGSCLWYPGWFCGGYTCKKSFSHRKRWKYQLILATRLLWFCDVTFRLALVLEAKMGDECAFHAAGFVVCGASSSLCDTSEYQGFHSFHLVPIMGLSQRLETRNKHEIDDHNVN